MIRKLREVAFEIRNRWSPYDERLQKKALAILNLDREAVREACLEPIRRLESAAHSAEDATLMSHCNFLLDKIRALDISGKRKDGQ